MDTFGVGELRFRDDQACMVRGQMYDYVGDLFPLVDMNGAA